MTDKERDFGRCFQPALPMNRANLRCLGLSVGIAIALGGCSGDMRDATTYSSEADAIWDATAQPGLRGQLARMATADKRITRGEVAAYAAELQASGTEAQRAETTSGSVHDGPTAESGTPAPRPVAPETGEK